MNHQFFKLPGSWVDIEWSKIWRLSTIRSLGGKLRGHCSCDQAMHTAGSYHHHYVIEHVMCRWPKGFLFYFYLYKTDNCLIIYWIRNHNWHYSLNKQHKTDSLSEWAKHNQLKFAKANLFFFFLSWHGELDWRVKRAPACTLRDRVQHIRVRTIGMWHAKGRKAKVADRDEKKKTALW